MRSNLSLVVAILSLVVAVAPVAAAEWVVQAGVPKPINLRSTEDGRVMAAASHGHSVGIWRDGRLRWVLLGDAVELSRDGALALISDQQSRPRLVSMWNTKSGQRLLELRFEASVRSIAWIDHRFAVLTGERISLFSSTDGALLRSIEFEQPRIGSYQGLLVSREHEFIVSRTSDTLFVWSLTDGRKLLETACEFKFERIPPTYGALSGDGKVLAAACAGSTRRSILLWDAVANEQTRFPTRRLARWLDLDNRARRLAAGFDNSVHVYELAPKPKTNRQGELVSILDRQYKYRFGSLSLSPSGGQLFLSATATSPNRVIKLIPGYKETELGHGMGLYEARFTRSEESLWAFGGQALCEWSLAGGESGGKPLRCAGSNAWQPATQVEVAATGRHLVSAHGTFIRSWALETGKTESYAGRLFALSADGEVLATGPYGGDVHLWRLDGKKRIAKLDQAGRITHFVASRNGRGFVTVAGNTLAIWDGRGNKQREIRDPEGTLGFLAYDAVSARLFVAKTDGRISGWDLENERELPPMSEDGPNGHSRFDWVPNSNRLWTTGNSEQFALWDSSTGAMVKQATSDCSSAIPAAALDDDHLIVSVGRQSCLGLLSFSAPKELKCLQKHLSFVSAIEVLDGRIASGSDAGKVKIWRPQGEDAVLELPSIARESTIADSIPPRHYGGVKALAWDPPKRFLAVADEGGVIWLWQANGRLLARLVSPNSGAWAVLASDGRWESSHPDPPGVTVWVDGRPEPLGHLSEHAEKGLLTKLIAAVGDKFP